MTEHTGESMFLSRFYVYKHFMRTLLLLELFTPMRALADAKYFLISLPVLTFGREGAVRGEYNLFQKGTLALEWVEWVGRGKREELTNPEIKANPGSSLLSEGRELSLMFGRYTDPLNMSGFHWGMGAGYRLMKAYWVRSPNARAKEGAWTTPSIYHVNAAGPTLAARLGYRYVGENIGFALGSFVGVKHYINEVTDASEEDLRKFSHISIKDRHYLQKKFATSLKIGIEIGWAF